MSIDSGSDIGRVPGGDDRGDADVDVTALDDEELRRHVARLDEVVQGLAGTVRSLAVRGGQPVGAAGVATSSGAGDGQVSGVELVAWVQWLVARYQLGDIIPPCWMEHGALVEELDALRVGWLDTIGKGKGDLAGMQWHDYFGRAVERIERRWRARGCGDTHRDPIVPGWVTTDPQWVPPPDLAGARYQPPPR